jgi:glycosyltransferase involved in cell wall biosynthesis
MDGMQSQIIARADAGKTVGSFDHAGLAHLVEEAAADYGPFEEMGRNGRRFVEKRLLLPDILERYANVIEAVAQRRPDALPAWEPFL